MGIFDLPTYSQSQRQGLGNFVDQVGTWLGRPEGGRSEQIAGGPTLNTQQPQSSVLSASDDQANFQNPIGQSNVDPGGYPVINDFQSQPYTAPTSGTAPAPTGEIGDTGGEPDINQLLQEQSDSVLGDLDSQLFSLGGQQESLLGQVGAQGTSAQSDLDLQNTQGLQSLGQQETKTLSNESKTLKDLSSNVSNAFRAGNVYLGAKGAGDSSAANQYAYALTKLASRERSNVKQNTADILSDIDARETNLGNIYNTETNKIKSWISGETNKIGQWYQSAVQQIQTQKTQVKAQLSQQILDEAMRALDQITQQSADRQTALEQWALSNSETFTQLKSNFQQISSPTYQQPTAGKLDSTPQISGGSTTPTFFGSASTNEEEPSARLI